MTDFLRKKTTGETGNAGEFGTHTHTADGVALTRQHITTTVVLTTEVQVAGYPLPKLPDGLPEPDVSLAYGEDDELNLFLSFTTGEKTTTYSVWRNRLGEFTNSAREGVEYTPWDGDVEDDVDRYAVALYSRVETRLDSISDQVLEAAGADVLASLGIGDPAAQNLAPIMFGDDGAADVTALSDRQAYAVFDALSARFRA